MSRRKFVDVAKRRLRIGNVSEIKIVEDPLAIDFSQPGSSFEQRLDLGPEYQPLSVDSVMQRLLAEAVTGQKQRSISGVINREREHPTQSAHTVAADLLIEMENGLSIGVGAENVAAGAKLVAQLNEVINLSVIDNPNSFVFVG